ncbi:MAG: hypothetical protein KGD59_01305 [Candidatus Heimdallarchaeota archaeon]|nr:hypothetical protein [Candidatus Heimdallarchaeota archaeon]MBY8993157.1 hypothetical protein [Candidatus Heimdallarchaeota archaeon]
MEKKIKDLDVKYKEKKEDKEILERIADVYKIETRHAIIMAINAFGSSNIKKLAKILNKNEATIYYHIKELIKKPELLRLDEEITHSQKGIFYKLTDLALEHFSEPPIEKMEEVFTKLHEAISSKTDEEIATFYYNLMAKNPDIGDTAHKDRKRLAYNHILENFMINNLERIEKAVKSGAKPKDKDYPIGSISISMIDLKISKPRHLFEILKTIAEMYGKLYRLQDKFTKEMNEQSIPEEERIVVHYHTVGGELKEFELE